MNRLQKSLRINALFSSISGIGLLLFTNQIATLFATSNTLVFQIIGYALLFFATTIVYEVYKQRPKAVLWIIIQDFTWVISSFILVISNPFEISKSGNSAVTVIAFIVFFMGVNQTKALAQVDNDSIKGFKKLKFERIIKASKKDVWKVISDVANYDKFAPNIDAVTIISGNGQGMVRSCSHGKDSWSETCTNWVEEETYSFKVDTSAPDYPYPFKSLKGTWEVQEINENTTKVIMVFDFQYKRKFHNWLLHPLLKGKFSKTAEELLSNWQRTLEK